MLTGFKSLVVRSDVGFNGDAMGTWDLFIYIYICIYTVIYCIYIYIYNMRVCGI